MLTEKRLDLKNVSGYKADNASVNYGVNDSVYQKLLKENEELIAAHCNNPILHNCAKYAFEKLSFDVENFVLKIYAEFSNATKKIEALKSFFEFCECEYHEVLRHVLKRWLSLFAAVERILKCWKPLKSYFISLGDDDCHTVIWNMISDQENELSNDDEPTIAELHLYFTHFLMSTFQEILLKLESKTILVCDLHTIMSQFRSSLQNKLNEKFFRMKVTFALRKGYLPVRDLNKFKTEALQVYQKAIEYLEKWYNFDNTIYRLLSQLNLETSPPTFEEMLQIWSLTPWKKEVPSDSLFDEISALREVINNLNGETSLDKWKHFFSVESAPTLLKIFQYCASIPVSNASVERIFSVMGNVWTDERNRLHVNSVRSELCIFFNIPYFGIEIKNIFHENKELIKAARSNSKYIRNYH